MKKRQFLIMISIVGIIAIIVIIMTLTIDIKKFQFQFEVDKSNSSLDVEKVTFNGKLIQFPFSFYYMNGTLSIDDKVYSVEKYKRKSNPYIEMYDMDLFDKENSDFFNGKAHLVGDIIHNNVESMYILIDITNEKTGFTKGEFINCYTEH